MTSRDDEGRSPIEQELSAAAGRVGAVPEDDDLGLCDRCIARFGTRRRTKDFRTRERETSAAPKRPTGRFTPSVLVPNVDEP